MEIELHKKSFKVWLMLIAASAIAFVGTATIYKFMGGPDEIFQYTMHNFCSLRPAEGSIDPERMALAALGLEALAKKVMTGQCLNIAWVLILQYALSMVLVKYLSRSVIYIGGKEIDV